MRVEATCEQQGKRVYYEVFRRYVLDPETGATPSVAAPSYSEIATACGISLSDVTNYLSWTRRAVRNAVLEHLHEITANEEEFREEARSLGLVAPLGPKVAEAP